MAAIPVFCPQRWARQASRALAAIVFSILCLTGAAAAAVPSIQSNDGAGAVAVDQSGNVYVTGYSSHGHGFYHIATVKYDAAGKQLWVRHYRGPGNGMDSAAAMVLDGSGNVYITGHTTDPQGNWDYLTLKYSADGALLWARTYNGPGNGMDRALAIGVDSQGYAYVTGHSQGAEVTSFATIRYSPDGDEVWVRRYDGPTGLGAHAVALAVDKDGNIIVTGYTPDLHVPDADDYSDIATVKYSGSGGLLWAQTWDFKTDNGKSLDRPAALALDSQGNIFVTGLSSTIGSWFPHMVILKYKPDGEFAWYKFKGTLSAGKAVAVDAFGDVYVAGSIQGQYPNDLFICKYGAHGEARWTRTYNGPGNNDDEAEALALDGQGNVYVAGKSYGSGTSLDFVLLKYNTGGEKLWVRRYDGGNGLDAAHALAMGPDGNVLVAGSSDGAIFGWDYCTLKYDPNGKRLWVRRYDGLGSNCDLATGLGVDGQGNVYVTGCANGPNSFDYATLAYDAAGQKLWTKRYNGPGNHWDLAAGLALDGQGNVYVSGYSVYDAENWFEQAATVKYTAAGEQAWAVRTDGIVDYGYALALDSQGNILVTGDSIDFVTYFDFLTVKYGPDGSVIWSQRFNRSGSLDDTRPVITVDAADNVIVSGRSEGSNTNFSDFATVKYDADGVKQWEKFYNGPGNSDDAPVAVATDAAGNVYVTGRSEGSGTGSDYATVKYSPAGKQLWVRRYNGPGNGADEPAALAVDGQGNVYVTGRSQGDGTYFDYATIKYSPSGQVLWVRRYNGPGRGADEATALAVDAQGNVYVTGTSYGSATGMDYATVKYNTNGVKQWVKRYSSPGENWDGASAIAADSQGHVYVTGSSYRNEASSYDYVTVKYNAGGQLLWARRENRPGL